MNFKIFSLISFLTFSLTGRADVLRDLGTGIYLSPYVGQVVNGPLASSPASPPDPSEPYEAKYDTKGMRYGLQIGWKIQDFVIGIDGSYANLDYSYSSPDNSSVPDSSIGVSHYGGFLMYRKFKIVPWIGAIFETSATDDKQDLEFKDGSGIQLGLGFKLFRRLQLNFEGRTYSFTKLITNGVERTLPDDKRKEFRGSEFLVGISIPFEMSKGREK